MMNDACIVEHSYESVTMIRVLCDCDTDASVNRYSLSAGTSFSRNWGSVGKVFSERRLIFPSQALNASISQVVGVDAFQMP